MPATSNLYAEKIFAEHPSALWPLDDGITFASLIPQILKGIDLWTVQGGIAKEPISEITPPIPGSKTYSIEMDDSSELSVISPDLMTSSVLELDLPTLHISSYIYTFEPSLTSIELGYRYWDGEQFQEELHPFAVQETGVWAFTAKTFSVEKLKMSPTFNLIIRAKFAIENSSTILLNSVSLGQENENFSSTSAGVSPIQLPEDIEFSWGQSLCVPARGYGISDPSAFYMASSKSIYAESSGPPLVFGTSFSTRLFPTPLGSPSIIFPGTGMMNASGKYSTRSLEMWCKIIPGNSEPSRIMGPIGRYYPGPDLPGIISKDGIYVDGSFLTLKIGRRSASHYISEWGRPMLLNLNISENSASLLIDGDAVISIPIDGPTRNEYPEAENPISGNSQDWWGVFVPPDSKLFEISALAIYPYQVSQNLAKRRFVYGQGVEFPEISSLPLSGSTAFVDYGLSGYSKNYIYPDIGKWRQGVFDNLQLTAGRIGSPDYPVPEVVLSNDSIGAASWFSAVAEKNLTDPDPSPFIDFNAAEDAKAFFLINSLNFLSEDIKAIYGVFRPESEEDQIIFKIRDTSTNSYFVARIKEQELRYELYYTASEPVSISAESQFSVGTLMNVGFDVQRLAKSLGTNFSTFFSARDRLQMILGSNEDFSEPFIGKFYRLGLASDKNLLKIRDFFDNSGLIQNDIGVFDEDYSIVDFDSGLVGTPYTTSIDGGTPDSFQVPRILSHTASYTLYPRYYIGSFLLDVATDSYWQDYVPLSYFGKFVSPKTSRKKYDLDFLQIDFSAPDAGPNDPVDFFVSFQSLALGANKIDFGLPNIEEPFDNVIFPGADWKTTRYRVRPGTVIYPPLGVDFNSLALVFHLSIKASSSGLQPVFINSLEVASRSLNEVSPSPIGTRFGVDLTPFSARGPYIDYKRRNPTLIYKDSSPYLYLTQKSGVRLAGPGLGYKRGLGIDINRERAPFYKIGAFQFAMSYKEESLAPGRTAILETSSRNLDLSIFLGPPTGSRKRRELLVIDRKTGRRANGVTLYVNGRPVVTPFLKENEWNIVGVQVSSGLSFDGIQGAIRIVGPVLVNSISTYRLSEDQDVATSAFRTWAQLTSMRVESMLEKPEFEPTFWGDFLSASPPVTWEEILFIPTIKSFQIDPALVYSAYVGTNKVVVDDGTSIKLSKNEYSYYSSVSWLSQTTSPV